MKMTKKWVLFLCFFLGCTSVAQAGLVLGGTRLIFDGKRQEASMKVTNSGNKPTLVQSWVSNDSDDKKTNVFLVTPPLFRLEPESSNTLRVVLMKPLPQDRESLYWLNVKGIPPTDPNAENVLTFAINTQIKLIYRPTSLVNAENAYNSYKKVVFALEKGKLIAKNPTGYYINLQELKLGNTELATRTIAPFSQIDWNIKNNPSKMVRWNSVNDYGGYTEVATQTLK